MGTGNAVITPDVVIRSTVFAVWSTAQRLPSGPAVIDTNPPDAGYSVTQSVGNQVPFDPHVTKTVTLANNRLGSVFLGGTVNPAVNQRAGGYTGTVTLSVVFF